MKRVIYICTGNTCRSAMAEGFAREMSESSGLKAEFLSAGIMGVSGIPASELAIRVMNEAGIDISGHRSRGLTGDLLNNCDIAFGMEYAHVKFVEGYCPEASSRVYLLGTYAGDDGVEVPDPMGNDIEFFRSVRDIIEKFVGAAINRLENE